MSDAINNTVKKCNFWRHNWSKWEQFLMEGTSYYLLTKPVPFTRRFQKRVCLDCGYSQEEKMNDR